MVEEVKQGVDGDKPRLQHLKNIEEQMIEKFASEKTYELDPMEGYEAMEFEEKNATKYWATFPFPYMNGHLHLGKLLCKHIGRHCFVVSFLIKLRY